LQDELNFEEPQGQVNFNSEYRFNYASGKPQLVLSAMALSASGVRLKMPNMPDAHFELQSVDINDGRFDLGTMDLTLPSVAVANGKLALAVAEDGTLNWSRIIKAAPEKDTKAPPSKTTETPITMRAHLQNVSVQKLGLSFKDFSRQKPIGGSIGRLDLSLAAEVEQKGAELQAMVSDIALDLKDTAVMQLGEDETLMAVPTTQIRGGRFDLADRKIVLAEIRSSGGRISAWRTPDGTLIWQELTQEKGLLRRELEVIIKESEAKPWSTHLAKLELDQYQIRLSDRTLASPELYQLENIQLKLQDFRTVPDAPFSFDLGLDVRQGGRFQVAGTVDAYKPLVRLDLDTQSIALKPLQPYLSQIVRLVQDSGDVSVNGKLDFGERAEGALSFKGDAAINGLLLTLPDTKEPFLGWQEMDVRGIDLTIGPERLDIREINFIQPQTKLIIKQDGSLNLMDVVVAPPSAAPQPPAPAQKAKAPVQKKSGGAPQTAGQDLFPVRVKQVKIDDAKLFFADLTLTPQFSADIHNLKGVLSGLASAPDSRAAMDLAGRVDQYGTAKIKGELKPFDFEDYTHIDMTFRNLEMNDLTPYSVKFAGRTIDSGKLSVDLKYRIEASRLKGDHRIVVDSLVLGERGKSPTAKDLPLDLAVALLKDPNDRIDIGLPVTGSLDDPQFAIGQVIWKTLATLITKIATAPFRVLGSLISGGADQNLDVVLFEVGDVEVPPPEAEKLVKLAGALQQRPQLAIEVQGGYDPKQDALALKDRAMRQEVAASLGMSVEAGQPLPPVSVTDENTQALLERLATERLAAAELAELKAAHGMTAAQSPPPKLSKSSPPATPPDPPQFYQALYERLRDRTRLPKGQLEQVARQRADAVVKLLSASGQVDPARMNVAPRPLAVDAKSESEGIKTKLSVKVVK
jgi:hypothetical protein